MPPKPTETSQGAGIEFYNIDFSLQNQLRLAGANVPAPTPIPSEFLNFQEAFDHMYFSFRS